MRLSNGNLLDQLRYTYTATGQVASEIDAGNRTHGFGYNLRGELISETHPDLGTGIAYTYDADGNRTKVVRNGVNEFYGYAATNPDQLLWTNGTNAAPTPGQAGPYNLFSYDDFGNMSRRDRRDSAGNRKIVDFAWDADGRLRQALDESTSASLLTATYAGDGDRITRTDSVTGNHVYSYGLYDSYQQTYYTPRFQQRQSVQGPDRFFHTDWLGSTRYMTNENGTAAPAMLRYDAYGNRSAWQGTDPAHPTDYQWAGGEGYMREADTSLGLDYLYQRYYDASIGRFISRDPIGWAGGVNLYGYCSGDPVNAVDPSGLDPWYDYGIPIPLDVAQALRAGARSVDPIGVSDLGEALMGVEFFTHQKISRGRALHHFADRWTHFVLDELLPSGEVGSGVPCPVGRTGKQSRLRELGGDPKVSSSDRGWIRQELNAMARGKRTTIRVPPGKVLAHRRGLEARKGFGYKYSDLQEIGVHKIQHRYEGYR